MYCALHAIRILAKIVNHDIVILKKVKQFNISMRMGSGLELHNQELHSFYRLPNIFRVIKFRRLRWTFRMEEGKSAFKISTGTPTRYIPLGRPTRRWEDKIRMNLKEIGINTRNWIDSAQDSDYWRPLANTALNLRIP